MKSATWRIRDEGCIKRPDIRQYLTRLPPTRSEPDLPTRGRPHTRASTTPAGFTLRWATTRRRTSRDSTMRPEANLQRRSGRGSTGFSCSLASSGVLVASLHRWRGYRRNHFTHHQPQQLIVRESGAGPTVCSSGTTGWQVTSFGRSGGQPIATSTSAVSRPRRSFAQPTTRFSDDLSVSQRSELGSVSQSVSLRR